MNPIKRILNKIRGIETEFKPKLYPAKNMVMLSNESDLILKPCKVTDDHNVAWKEGRKKKTGRIMRKPHIMEIPLKAMHPHPIFKYFAPKRQRYRVYTIQSEGEFTHSPNTTGVSVEDKKKFEAVLKLEGQMVEAHLTREAVNDMKDHKKAWFDYIPYIAMAIMAIAIVFIMNGGTT